MDPGMRRWRTPAALVLAVAVVLWTSVGAAGAIGIYQGATSGNSLNFRVSDPPTHTWFGVERGMQRAITIERNTGVNLEGIQLKLGDSTGFDLAFRYRAGASPEDTGIDGVQLLTRINTTHPGLDEHEIEAASVEFSVTKRRLRELDVGEGAVELYRFHDAGWELVAASLTAERFGSYVYEGRLPSLSEIAIGVRHPNVDVLNPYVGQSTVEEGSQVLVFVKVFNDGSTTAHYPVDVATRGTVIRHRNVTLTPGESQNLRIPVRFEVNGTFPLSVNGVDVGVLRVTPRESSVDSTDETPDRPGENVPPAATRTDREMSRGMPGFTVLIAVVAALATAAARRV